ncbi:hypothetical protein GGR58DRAFT_206647 [Xylaria digitata]|nr:hypothetical protein GGR58DRAFT_206647 [Xylaria digitata]
MKVIKQMEELERPQEHVFLVNCMGSSDSESEAAYYSSAPVADPDTIAVVTTPSEGLKQWEDSTTITTFTDAGSTHQTGFMVTLGSRPDDGDIAGYASNSWNVSFACYAQAPTFLYTHEDRDCFSVYDCSHANILPESSSPTPSMVTLTSLGSTSIIDTPTTSFLESETITAIPITRTTTILYSSSIQTSAHSPTTARSTATSTATHVPVTSATDVPAPHPTKPQVETAAGIAIGVTVGTILLAVTTISLLRRYWRWRGLRESKASDVASGTEPSQVDGRSIYEAGGNTIPVELLGSYMHVHELEARPRRDMRVGAG